MLRFVVPGRFMQRRLDRRATISVEMAIISAFFLLPLLAGGADFVELIAAKSQLNATLHSMDAYAWNNPGNATDTTQLALILAQVNRRSLPMVTFPDGRSDSSTTYQPALSYECNAPGDPVQTLQSTPCPAADTQQMLITYSLSNPFVLNSYGQVQVQ
jgi:hypothetical protein